VKRKLLFLITLFSFFQLKQVNKILVSFKPQVVFAESDFVTTDKSNYDVESYRNYNNRNYDSEEFKDRFYFAPLIKLSPEYGTDEDMHVNLRDELTLSGYEAYPMVENVPIDAIFADKLIEKYFELYPNEEQNLPTTSTERLGTDNAKYPIWRDVSGKQFLMTSLEEYMGFKDLYSKDDPALAELNTAPINSLLSQEQACIQGWRSLGAQTRACNRLEDRMTCALTKRKIPGSNLEVHDVMTMLSDFDPMWGAKDDEHTTNRARAICHYLFSTDNKKLSNSAIDLKKILINVPTYMDRSYRIGFLVAAIETRPACVGGINCDENNAEIIFNFFTSGKEDSMKDEVLVTAFKLPDIGTNKGPSSLGHEEWDDPLDLTREVLTTKQQQEYHDYSRKKRRSSAKTAAFEAEKYQDNNSRINCYRYEGGSLSGTKTCLSPLPQALVDIINANVKTDDYENHPEKVKILNDLAGLRVNNNDDTKKIFDELNGRRVLLRLFLGSEYNQDGDSPGFAEVELKSQFTVNTTTYRPRVRSSKVHFYLVYPMGYELKDIEQAIQGAFFNKKQIAENNENKKIPETFEMTGQAQSLEGGKVGWKYYDPERTANVECGYQVDKITGVVNYNKPKLCYNHPSIKIKQRGGKVDILGARLGWIFRNIQTSLNSKASLAYNYFESCKTTEEFLLGKCEGGSAK